MLCVCRSRPLFLHILTRSPPPPRHSVPALLRASLALFSVSFFSLDVFHFFPAPCPACSLVTVLPPSSHLFASVAVVVVVVSILIFQLFRSFVLYVSRCRSSLAHNRRGLPYVLSCGQRALCGITADCDLLSVSLRFLLLLCVSLYSITITTLSPCLSFPPPNPINMLVAVPLLPVHRLFHLCGCCRCLRWGVVCGPSAVPLTACLVCACCMYVFGLISRRLRALSRKKSRKRINPKQNEDE